ncbi:MAG: hypothetical protein ACXVP0_00645 [Bacteroidia bacterium]
MSASKLLSIIATGFCCLTLFIIGSFMLDEGYNPAVPDIDTKYAANCTEAKFNEITVGMDTSEVIRLVGQPIGKRGSSTQKWNYTADEKCQWHDFAWLNRNLVIDSRGKVKLILKTIEYY